jgi:hypothetical protein
MGGVKKRKGRTIKSYLSFTRKLSLEMSFQVCKPESRVSRGDGNLCPFWIPASAGMTELGTLN